jgi:hypothetical protein
VRAHAGCGHVRPCWQVICRRCWRRLPLSLTAPVVAARRAKAPHLIAKAEIDAVAWLTANPEIAPAEIAARVCGEAPP